MTGSPLLSLFVVALVIAAILGHDQSKPVLLSTGGDGAVLGPANKGPELLAVGSGDGHGPTKGNNH